MYEAIAHWKQYKQEQNELQQAKQLFEECGFQYKAKAKQESKKYTQKPAEIPGGMILEMMKDVEDEIISKQEYDKWLNELIKKNGTTKY